MNDLLEQLVGDLVDDRSAPRELPPIERIDSQTWRIRGIAPLDEVAAQLRVDLPHDDYDTFGGFLFGLLGAVPNDGSTPELEAYGFDNQGDKDQKAGIRNRGCLFFGNWPGLKGMLKQAGGCLAGECQIYLWHCPFWSLKDFSGSLSKLYGQEPRFGGKKTMAKENAGENRPMPAQPFS